jgi:hypothetical protein
MTRVIKFRLLSVTAVAVLLISLLSIKVLAQDTSSITLNVTPVTVEHDANRGDKIEGSFKVVNGSDKDLQLTPTPKNFTASDELGGVNLTEEDTNYSLAKWISVTPETVDVSARGSQVFNYTISIPGDAEPGGHFGSIIVSTNPVNIDATGPLVSQEVGPLILVRIAGDTYQEATIVEFSTPDNILEKGPVTLQTRVKNTGNVHFKPKGTIEIKNMFGNVVANLDLEERNVLPDSIRKLTNDWNPSGLNIGRYTANLTLVYGVDNKIVTASTSFVLFPYKTVIPLVLIIAGLLIYGVKRRDRIKKALTVLKNG